MWRRLTQWDLYNAVQVEQTLLYIVLSNIIYDNLNTPGTLKIFDTLS